MKLDPAVAVAMLDYLNRLAKKHTYGNDLAAQAKVDLLKLSQGTTEGVSDDAVFALKGITTTN